MPTLATTAVNAPDDRPPHWPTRPISPEQMGRYDDGPLCELVDGLLVEKRRNAYAQWAASKVSNRLSLGWVRPNAAGLVFTRAKFHCFPGRPDLVRRPDVAFIPASRLVDYPWNLTHLGVAPALAVEVAGPEDARHGTAMEDRVREYHAADVPLVWVLDPVGRTARTHPAGEAQSPLLTHDDELDGGDVLPGFRCRVADLFPARPA